MMKIITRIFSFLSLVIALAGFQKVSAQQNCSILHEGKFKYATGKDKVIVEIKGNDQKELHENGKYFIKSKIEWVNDCEYNMTMTEITVPDFPFGPGDVMNVKINKVVGKDIFFTATVKGQSREGKITKTD